MASANQQNNSFLRTVTSLTLLGGIAASFAWACVSSSSDNKGTGGAAGTIGGSTSTDTNVGGNAGTANVGGHTSAGAGNGTGGAPAAPCATPDGGVITAPLCTTSAAIFETFANANGTFGTAAVGDFTGGAGAPWTVGAASALTSDMSAGNWHISGSISGGTAVGAMFGFNLYFQQSTDADAGGARAGCWVVDAHQYSGMTVDITAVSVPNNILEFGVNLANGNQAETATPDVAITADGAVHTIKLPWSKFVLKNKCGTLDPATITGIYAFGAYLSDTAVHPVDVTIDNWGFY